MLSGQIPLSQSGLTSEDPGIIWVIYQKFPERFPVRKENERYRIYIDTSILKIVNSYFRQAHIPVTAEDRPAERAVLETLKNIP